MNNMPFVFLDGDDTLWKTQEIYEDAKVQFASIMNRSGITDIDVIAALDDLDMQRVPLRGFTLNRFLESMLILYIKVSTTQGLPWNQEIEKEIWDIEKLLTRPPTLYDDALPALQLLQTRTRLYLLSSGDQNIQNEKITKLGIKNYFNDIFIVSTKNENVFQHVLDSLKQLPRYAWMVGNSLKSDVLPSKNIGMHSIHVNRGTWKYDTVQSVQVMGHDYIQVNTLIEAASIILEQLEEVK